MKRTSSLILSSQPPPTKKQKRRIITGPRHYPRAGPEWKYLDVALAGTVDAAGATYLLNGLSLGNSATTRIGQSITIKSIEIRLYTFATVATGTAQAHRVAVIQDKQTNGAQALSTAFWTSASTTALRNLGNRKRFKTLTDITYTIAASPQDNTNHYSHMYLKPKYIVTEYNAANAGDVTDIATNSIFIYIHGTNAAGVTAGSSAGLARIRYTDN